MRYQLFMCLWLVTSIGNAQIVEITFKDSTRINTSINSASTSGLFTKNGAYQLSGIASILFESDTASNQLLYRKLRAAGVRYAFSDSPIDRGPLLKGESFGNFSIENRYLVWREVYVRPGIKSDSLRKILFAQMRLDNTIRVVVDDPLSPVFEVSNKIFQRGGDRYSGRLLIEIKDEKYRISFQSITVAFGARTMITTDIWLGSYSSAQLKNQGDRIIEDFFLNKAKTNFKNPSGLAKFGSRLKQSFDYQMHTKKEDW
jgi:hypothetical protein